MARAAIAVPLCDGCGVSTNERRIATAEPAGIDEMIAWLEEVSAVFV